MVDIFKHISNVSAIIRLTSYEKSYFRTEKTGHWSFVCKTKIPPATFKKIVKSLTSSPTADFCKLVNGYSGSA